MVSELLLCSMPKPEKWVKGRKNIFERLEEEIPQNEKIIWMHCASLGEFEQGRPVDRKTEDPISGFQILLTFFSPSGYEVKKDYNRSRLGFLSANGWLTKCKKISWKLYILRWSSL